MGRITAEYKDRRDKVLRRLPVYYGVILKGKYPRIDINDVYLFVNKRRNCEKTLALLEEEFPAK